MWKRIPVFLLLFLLVIHPGFAQDVVVPLPQGEGYAVKKAPPSANARWELKIINQGTPAMGERTVVEPASFYKRDVPPEAIQSEGESASQEAAMPMQSQRQEAPEAPDYSQYPIKRLIKSETPEHDREQVTAFIEAYNQVLLNSPPDEPIEIIIDKAAWQYWYNQMTSWEEYISKSVFLKKDFTSTMNKLDFSSLDALKNSVTTLANEANTEADKVIRSDHVRNLGFLNRLDRRENARNDYRQWLEDQKSLVIDFTHQWARKENEQEINIDGVIYLLSEKPLESVPRNAVNLVTPRLTPYDLLNADGTLKKPID
ncbi:hypothetical protein JW926_09145 [Candidatus Sumerlaeota bacterium]|nr:hypothetical protein [Candidatus Sumerlaeota bacterium]